MRFRTLAVSLLLVPLVSAQPGSAKQSTSNIEQELIKLDQQLAQAQSRGDVNGVARLLADEYTFTDQTGRMGTKKEALANAKAAGPDKDTIENSEYKVTSLGDSAVMTHLSTIKGDGGRTEYLRSLHVWVKRANTWQIAAHQWTPVAVPSRSPSPLINAKCAEYSFEPEVFQFYGDANAVLRKLNDDTMGLEHRRAYLLMIETADSAEVAIFERPTFEDKNIAVALWRGKTAGDLRQQLTDTILTNRGLMCMGEQAIRVVKTRLATRTMGQVVLPVTAKEAFGHFVKKHGETYMRVTALLLC